ncbi:MAG: hypothetical protein P8Y67_01390 [Alphaproteobacteria bacterium]
MWLLRLIFKPIGFVLVGLIIASAGGLMVWNGNTAKPLERSELTKIEGTVQQVVKTWKQKAGIKTRIKYNVDVKSADGQTVKLVMPEKQISEAKATSIDGEQITALVSNAFRKKVWELVSQGQKIISYEDTYKEEVKSLAAQAEYGPYAAGGGALILLIGLFRFKGRK